MSRGREEAETVGAIVGLLNLHFIRLGRTPFYAMACLLQTTALVLVFVGFHGEKHSKLSDENRVCFAVAVSFLLGITEAILATLAATCCSSLMKERRAEAIFVCKLYQALASSLLLFVRRFMEINLSVSLVIQALSLLVSLPGCLLVFRQCGDAKWETLRQSGLVPPNTKRPEEPAGPTNPRMSFVPIHLR